MDTELQLPNGGEAISQENCERPATAPIIINSLHLCDRTSAQRPSHPAQDPRVIVEAAEVQREKVPCQRAALLVL